MLNSFNNKPTKNDKKNYTVSDIQSAIAKVESKEISLRKASFDFKKTLTTLHDRISILVLILLVWKLYCLSKDSTEEIFVHVHKSQLNLLIK
jgi:hypothetical protein